MMGKKSKASDRRSSKLLREYLKDSNRSDREIAKILGVSQPTVSRMKSKLLNDGVLQHFSAIPDLAKMGYEILAFSIVKFNIENIRKHIPEIEKMARGWAERHPEILFDSRAEGMGVNAITISVHKNYAEYKNFLADAKNTWGKFMFDVHFILVDLKGGVNKPFSFKYLAEEKEK
ncbi:MAG: Lrp/AsnC family transcriptional regulator [Candidatus Bathyarchaeota archaeon]|nr:Lrp/AsnC family transcriptional regulator [Candidatus Bathyarchaeum sp.]